MAATSDGGNSRATRYAAGGLGLIVFLVGVALLIYVFNAANALLNAPAPTVPPVTPSPGASPAPDGASASAATDIGRSLADHVRRLLVLLVMCFAGSAVASLGIRLFFSARNAAAGAVVPGAAAPPPAAPPPAAPPAPKADPGE